MQSLPGKITSKLLNLFKPDDPAWKPPADRNDSPKRGRAIPKGVQGQSITGRKRGRP